MSTAKIRCTLCPWVSTRPAVDPLRVPCPKCGAEVESGPPKRIPGLRGEHYVTKLAANRRQQRRNRRAREA